MYWYLLYILYFVKFFCPNCKSHERKMIFVLCINTQYINIGNKKWKSIWKFTVCMLKGVKRILQYESGRVYHLSSKSPYFKITLGVVHKLRLQDEVGRWLSKCQQGVGRWSVLLSMLTFFHFFSIQFYSKYENNKN